MANPRTKTLIGESNSFLEVLEQVSHLTSLNRPVLVVGERGTGKELIAERLHFLSERWSRPLVKMNCAALNQELLESELFGHEAGAFTGASKKHIGRFERADGGTLFLDELATMSLQTQEKLLRFIEYGEFERLGGSSTIDVDVRLVAATNEHLPTLADKGRFRHDLLDRLAFDVVTLPPLRARQEDIVLLAEHYALNMCKELHRPLFTGFSHEARMLLEEYQWPGNVRELKNVIERSIYRHGDNEDPIEDILFDPFDSPYAPLEPHSKGVPQQHTFPQVESAPIVGPGDPQPSVHHFPLDIQEHLQQQEKDCLRAALQKAQFNQREAAKLLRLSYHQLRGKLKKYHLLSD